MVTDKTQAKMRDASFYKTLQPFDSGIPGSGKGRLMFAQFVSRYVVVVGEIRIDPCLRLRFVIANG